MEFAGWEFAALMPPCARLVQLGGTEGFPPRCWGTGGAARDHVREQTFTSQLNARQIREDLSMLTMILLAALTGAVPCVLTVAIFEIIAKRTPL
jgi:hypothetical protein